MRINGSGWNKGNVVRRCQCGAATGLDPSSSSMFSASCGSRAPMLETATYGIYWSSASRPDFGGAAADRKAASAQRGHRISRHHRPSILGFADSAGTTGRCWSSYYTQNATSPYRLKLGAQ